MPSAMPQNMAPEAAADSAPAMPVDDASRVFVKNLPPNITEDVLRKHFSTGGRHITDIKLIARRRIAFIGYPSPEEAKAAIRYFHRSYIRMSKLSVELAKAISDPSLPTAYKMKRLHEAHDHEVAAPETEGHEDQPSKKRKLDESDPRLREFLQAMKPQHANGISSTADVVASMGDVLMAQAGDVDVEKDAAAALAAAEAESDDEYEALPAQQRAKRAKVSATDSTPATGDGAGVVISATAIEEVGRNAHPPDQPLPPAGEETQARQLPPPPPQEQKQAAAFATDDDWLRSRTNRLLDLMDPTEIAPPPATVATGSTGLQAGGGHAEAQDETPAAGPRDDVAKVTALDEEAVTPAAAPSEPVTPESQIRQTSRLFVRNLPYGATETHIWKYFEAFGTVTEVNLPVTTAGANKGFAMVLFAEPSAALAAFHNADGKTFQGRILHVLPAKAKKAAVDAAMDEFAISQMPLKKQRLLRKKSEAATNTFSWNALFMSQDAVNAAVAERMGVSKSEMLDPTSADEAVRQAVRQTSVIEETKSYFAANGVDLDAFKPHTKRGDRCILVKHFSYGTSSQALRAMFEEFGPVVRVLMPPGGTIAIVQFAQEAHGRLAYSRLAYRRVNDTVLMLEKCPADLLGGSASEVVADAAGAAAPAKGPKGPKVTAGALLGGEAEAAAAADGETGPAAPSAATSSLFVRNLNFTTTTEVLAAAFAGFDGYVGARVNTKPNPKRAGETLSMGFGFVEFRTQATAAAAATAMHGHILQGHTLTVQAAHRGHEDAAAARRTADRARKEALNAGSKLVVKNLPFEATRKDLRALLGTYGQLKAVRLPRKVGSGTRGYAFAEFTTPAEAAHAMEALHSTHLLGRRIVLQYAEAEALDPEAELAKMRRKVGSQVDTVALQTLTTGRRQRSKVQIGEDAEE